MVRLGFEPAINADHIEIPESYPLSYRTFDNAMSFQGFVIINLM